MEQLAYDVHVKPYEKDDADKEDNKNTDEDDESGGHDYRYDNENPEKMESNPYHK